MVERTDRRVVVGLAGARRPWFSDLARWSSGAVAPFDFVKCLTAEEARAVLAVGRPVSLLLVDATLPHWDRDLVHAARTVGTPTVLVGDDAAHRDWVDLGCVASLPGRFEPDELVEVLNRHGRPDDAPEPGPRRTTLEPPLDRGLLVAVTGAGGAGVSTVAMAVAQGLADEGSHGPTVLVDGARRSSLGMYHDVGDVIPGLPELVELHRRDRVDPDDIRALTFDVPTRSYRLLLGQRRPRDWTSMRPRALAASVDGLTRSFGAVVVDHDADLEGEDDTGSADVEDRHALARILAGTADAVLVVVRPGLHGMHRLIGLVDDLARHDVPLHRVVPVVNRAPRSPVERAELTRSAHDLTAERRAVGAVLAPTVFVPTVRRLEDLYRAGARLPVGPARVLARAVAATVAASGGRRDGLGVGDAPDRVIAPGELGVAGWDTGLGEEVA